MSQVEIYLLLATSIQAIAITIVVALEIYERW
jgi:hypothetical protein